MWLILGFTSLGLLVGTLIGLTSESVVTSVIGLLFALLGGSLLALLKQLSTDDRRTAGQALAALSLACLLGTYSGIVISEHQLLTPAEVRRARLGLVPNKYASESGAPARPTIEQNKYVRKGVAPEIQFIDTQYRRQRLTAEHAYDQLYQVLQDYDCAKSQGDGNGPTR